MTKKLETLPFALNDANYLTRLRDILAVRSIAITMHAKKRMHQRKISMQQIINCLKQGSVDEPAHLTLYGDWQATVGYFTGGDYVKVAAAISKDAKGDLIVIVTVII